MTAAMDSSNVRPHPHLHERGDLAHLVRFLWASAASAGLLFALRELSAGSRRFDDFVRELQRFNRKAHRRAGTFNKDRD